MKIINNFLFLGLLFTLLTNCSTGTRSLSKGLENESFLEFISYNSEYKEGVEVTLDDTQFIALVNNAKENPSKVNIYTISTGKHVIKVVYKSETLYEKHFFVTAQETKQIELP